jgi:hypothetical protein
MGALTASGVGSILASLEEFPLVRLFVLNEDLSFDQIDATAKAAFQTKFGQPSKDHLPFGITLYKFADFRTLTPPGKSTLSPWWSPYNAYKHDPGWDQRLRMAQANGVSIREWGRLTSAIKENWNSLAYLLIISLKVEACAFFGGFTSMVRIDPGEASKMKPGEARGPTKNLPGGGTQFYLPNLTAEHVGHWSVLDLAGL